MSFQNQGFWVLKGVGSDMSCDDSSRIEPKRLHQWFMNGPEVNLLPNKKQAVEVPNCLISEMLSSGASTWGTASSFHAFSGNFSEKLFDSEACMRTVNFSNRNNQPFGLDKLSAWRKDDLDPFVIDSSSLSTSHALDEYKSNVNYGGTRKVKVSQVKESENFISLPVGNVYEKGLNNAMSMPTALLFDQADDNFVCTSRNYIKGYENNVFIGEMCDRSDVNFIPVGQTNIESDDTLSTEQSYQHIDSTASTCSLFGEPDDNVISSTHSYNNVDDNSAPAVTFYNKVEENILSMNQNYRMSENNMSSIYPSYSNGRSTIISFGGCDDDDTIPSEKLLSDYELLMVQSTTKKPNMLSGDLVRSKAESLLFEAPVSGTESVYKEEETKVSKKLPSNNFPSNVRSLLSTGILDGVPVKYIAWFRQKELRGAIKGSGYSCGCLSCNFLKVVNAYEFEQHAGCKTKHPNNHIYFENGKTVYGIVQELRRTPQSLLLEVIPTISGSPINQKSFRIWKESFLAATRELQRIYGTDEGKQL